MDGTVSFVRGNDDMSLVPGHDPAVFALFPSVWDRIVRIE